ncbi:hypothetical protein POG77_09950 [Lactococcus petauri]|jgi:protein-arginine kinase activator protein McsA|uniref:hypothetical protein n=1 Tax=Lactococcus TaxID=1357 RepID=UPI001CE26C1F|nr:MULTISPECIES: hypothetical protein [Lactococcus]MDC0816035.1 hypothetical protein [Lactococcus petauri]MDC0818078.1 hypothetical protein [Lactococcus petauri]MDC0824736.1 hypothetical protein [Lactococcus petauri]MDC0831244.1 hypothetical protein [Lactococcus petauri]
MIKEIVTLFLILTVSIVSYTWCAIRADKARRYYEKQGDKATEVLEQLTKLWGSSATTHKKVNKCENCHENTAMATVDHELLCRSCYEKIEVEE